jgi:hypothetical protein
MPYVPSEKTDGKSQDRKLIDKEVKILAEQLAEDINHNSAFSPVYYDTFFIIGTEIINLLQQRPPEYLPEMGSNLAKVIFEVGRTYGYEGAFLGELNYAITRLIQEVPNVLVKLGKQKSALRYYIYAYTVDALTSISLYFHKLNKIDGNSYGIAGVFEDVKDEYKWRVNRSYEAEQILKSGDCYDTPFFTKLIEVVDEEGNTIGYTDLYLKNDGKNYKLDKLPYKIIIKKE